MAQLGQGAALDLSDALTGEVEHLADVGQGAWVGPVESVTKLDDDTFSIAEEAHRPAEVKPGRSVGGMDERVVGVLVLYEIAELGVAFRSHRAVQ